MAEWKKFTGSDEQLEEIVNAKNGWIVRFHDGDETEIEHGEFPENFSIVINKKLIKEYLLCEPNPHAEMIKRWVDTGQPVYKFHEFDNEWRVAQYPRWMPKTKYSFNPPKKEKEFIEVRDYLINVNGIIIKECIHKNDAFPEVLVRMAREKKEFIRWLDEDWRKIEV